MYVDRKVIDAATATLIERWPMLAPWNRKRVPIKIGIHRDILAAGVIDADICGAVLAAYVRSRSYLSNSIAGAARLDLEGQPAGVVTEGEARGAQKRGTP
jgi:ProP effector